MCLWSIKVQFLGLTVKQYFIIFAFWLFSIPLFKNGSGQWHWMVMNNYHQGLFSYSVYYFNNCYFRPGLMYFNTFEFSEKMCTKGNAIYITTGWMLALYQLFWGKRAQSFYAPVISSSFCFHTNLYPLPCVPLCVLDNKNGTSSAAEDTPSLHSGE